MREIAFIVGCLASLVVFFQVGFFLSNKPQFNFLVVLIATLVCGVCLNVLWKSSDYNGYPEQQEAVISSPVQKKKKKNKKKGKGA